jgi:GNAT superfamily N-acetyltransferase
MTLHIVTPENPSEANREAVLRPLRAYNTAQAGDPRIRPVALLLADEAGNHVGGLWGKCAYDWLFVDLLAVPEEYRGGNYGKTLMERAEEIARATDCVGMWLDTFEFQARVLSGDLDETVAAIRMRLCGRDGSEIVAARQAMQGQLWC